MKKMSQIVVIFMLGAITSFAMNVAANAVISAGSVSYGNTTVNTALDELFSAVDINEKIGTTDISGIGNGTITGAIGTLKTYETALSSSSISTYFSTVQINSVVKYGNIVKYDFRGLISKEIPNPTYFSVTDSSWPGYRKPSYVGTLNAYLSDDAYMQNGATRAFAWCDSVGGAIFVGGPLPVGKWLHISGFTILE